ncbi:IS701 family transposase [Spongiactinospora sp. TRM90649]|uniref:IS701 family transposase n=1 Tax=Spongiactinospora sp. TRM90649 TaxID=3031114 RepID=UPI0023F8C8FD|nr:IS701 family transposase [Spongiactinospora sp. TRM90649]MDF5754615.1 IS701 family transposase [Spongiactinospora sp. TRM90649]
MAGAGLQRLLCTARWDADEVRDDVRTFVIDRLDPGGVLIADETGFVKKGAASAGVQRQYSGTAGRIENCQIGVFLAYATPAGRHCWIGGSICPSTPGRGRCRAAGVPDEISFATKPVLAVQMILAAIEAGVPASWVSGDEVYGQDPRLRATLEQHRMGYVLAIAGNRRVDLEGVQVSAAEAATRVADRHWQRYSTGPGAKGSRWYAWARIDEREAGGYRWLLIRRNLATGELAFYRCYAPTRQPLLALVKIAGIRWAVEEPFQAAKGQTGLDLSSTRLDGLAPAHRPGRARPGHADGHRRRPAVQHDRRRHPPDPARDPPAARRPRIDPAQEAMAMW